MYDTVKDFETLVENLHPNGVRENALKNELKKRHADIVRAINTAKRSVVQRGNHSSKWHIWFFKQNVKLSDTVIYNTLIFTEKYLP